MTEACRCGRRRAGALIGRDPRDLGLHRATDLVGGFRACAAAGLPVDEEPARCVQ
ncbi:hypothetical protein [Brachybacterium sp. EE-P12]|uniref:hypothetical protein n=1 Tax=Brachybacterium sp. EE-P12 TaxID=2306299 RepID=UPI001F14FC2B|nr:hypothetical protein [Brachybacterium sp. EE-P12]